MYILYTYNTHINVNTLNTCNVHKISPMYYMYNMRHIYTSPWLLDLTLLLLPQLLLKKAPQLPRFGEPDPMALPKMLGCESGIRLQLGHGTAHNWGWPYIPGNFTENHGKSPFWMGLIQLFLWPISHEFANGTWEPLDVVAMSTAGTVGESDMAMENLP